MVKNLPAIWETQVDPWVGKIPWRRKWQPASVCLPGKSQGRRSLVGYSPWGCKESDTTEWLTLSLSCVCMGFPGSASGKESTCQCRKRRRDLRSVPGSGRFLGGGHGNPLSYSCLKNPVDTGAWRAKSMGSQGVGYDWSDLACPHIFIHVYIYRERRKWKGYSGKIFIFGKSGWKIYGNSLYCSCRFLVGLKFHGEGQWHVSCSV